MQGKWDPPAVTRIRQGEAIAPGSPGTAAIRGGAPSPRHAGLADLPFKQGFPAEATGRILRDELVFQRAVQGLLCRARRSTCGR